MKRRVILVVAAGLALAVGTTLAVAGFVGAGRTPVPAAAAPAGAQPTTADERTAVLRVDNMYCASCPYIVRQALQATPGVLSASVSFENKTALVTYDRNRTDVAALRAATGAAGYPSTLMRE